MSLNVTVTPGHSFTDSETVTTGKLNAAATPTVSMTGSIDSSELGAGSVDTTQLAVGAVTPPKMGESALGTPSTGSFTMKQDADDSDSDTDYQKKGNILVSGAGGAVDGKYEETFAGYPNRFLIGHAKKVGDGTDDVWTGDWTLRSKFLNSESSILIDQQDDQSITLKIGSFKLTSNMFTAGCVKSGTISDYSITLDKLTPGGGASTGEAGEPIAEKDKTFWGGLIDFNPDNQAGVTEYHGKAETLQPTAKHQVVYAVAEQQKLAFGHHPCIPKAFVYAHQTGGTYDVDGGANRALTASDWTIYMSSGVEQITRTGTAGVNDHSIRFAAGIYETGDTVKCMGTGWVRDNEVYMPLTGIHVVSPLTQAANNGTIDANRDVKVTFYFQHADQNLRMETPYNPTVIQLWFY
jgi:hypothetical protein